MDESVIEVWRVIAQAPNYSVSNMGRVKRSSAGKNTYIGRFVKPAISQTGYYRVRLQHEGSEYSRFVHNLVCRAFHGHPPTTKHQAAHWDGNKTDNRVDNLRWATPKENGQDKVRHGTTAIGDRNGSRIYPERLKRGDENGARTPEGRKRADSIRADNGTCKAIAQRHGVSPALVCLIRNGKAWA
jgi:HNH endonuclease/NUMOD4 motif